jgi:hypothetical protein
MTSPAKRKYKIKVTIDESLDKYDNVIPFPEKHEKMNGILKKTGHPENYLKQK